MELSNQTELDIKTELEKLKKENIELQNQLLDKNSVEKQTYIDPINDNKQWLDFVKKIKEKK